MTFHASQPNSAASPSSAGRVVAGVHNERESGMS